MERAVLNRMKPHQEENEIHPQNITGFRQGLATQHAMKLGKNQMLDNTTRGVKDILGLDLERAFDNIRHSFILQQISTLGVGQCLHDYIRDFLRGKQASLQVRSLQSEPVGLGD
ncbi:uncharacterized protein LOC142559345 [Dermacentor variabilis]|uniref:uncharacterized protein LOC142559345 n=1 Tax=Dermacentor variabilis TaxID=34621 RepID=UPI003F5C3204